MRTKTMKLLPLVGALALMGATAAQATEGFSYGGYFRDGVAVGKKNHNRTCFQAPGADWKYRLGNECDYYGELGLNYGLGKDDGPNFQVHWMPNFFTGGVSDAASLGGGPAQTVKTEQLYGEAKNMDFAPNTTFWAGTRFYGRADVHIVDTFFVNMSGTGGGADINLGGPVLGVALFRSDSSTTAFGGFPATSGGNSSTGAPGTRINVDLRMLPIAPGNTLRFTGAYTKGDFDAAHSPNGLAGTTGYGASVQWDLDLPAPGLKNTVWIQTSQGSAGANQGFGGLTDPSSIKTNRIVESPQWQIGNFGGQAIVAYTQHKSPVGTTKYTSVGGRGSFAITNNFKFLAEAGYDNVKPAGGGSSTNMTKITLAPTVGFDKGFWARPEIRFYVTYGKWNNATNAASGVTGYGDLGNVTSATTAGIQFEGWW